jgi:hypothetical protein
VYTIAIYRKLSIIMHIVIVRSLNSFDCNSVLSNMNVNTFQDIKDGKDSILKIMYTIIYQNSRDNWNEKEKPINTSNTSIENMIMLMF